MLPSEAEFRIRLLQTRIEAIRNVIDESVQEDLGEVLLEMLADGDRALRSQIAQAKPTIH